MTLSAARVVSRHRSKQTGGPQSECCHSNFHFGGPGNFSKQTTNATQKLKFININGRLDKITKSVINLLSQTPCATSYVQVPKIFYFYSRKLYNFFFLYDMRPLVACTVFNIRFHVTKKEVRNLHDKLKHICDQYRK
jgi:hypothetical protein